VGDKLPWMPFYGTDFYNDEAVRLLTLEEEALYIRLLWWQWREGSLPGDWADCQRLAGESLGDRLAKLFPVTRSADGRRRNPRLEIVRQEQLAHQKKRSRAGKIARQTQLGTRPIAGESPANRQANASQSPAKTETESNKKLSWLTPFADAWQAKCGNPPHGRLAKALAPLTKTLGVPETLERWSRYLSDHEPRYCSPESFVARHAAYVGPAIQEMTDDYGRMVPHRKNEAGDWVPVVTVA